MIEKLFRLILFGLIGLGAEVCFTSLSLLRKRPERGRVRLLGYSSLWYLPLYALVLPLGIYFLAPSLDHYPLIVRGLTYALLIQIGEFAAMAALHLLNGQSPSEKEYLVSGRSLYGFTRWDYFPAFIVLGLVFEYLVRHWLI